MKRRDVLGSLSAVSALSLAGCSSVPGGGNSGTVLGTVDVINYSFVPNRIRIAVERGEETLVDRDIGLSALDADDGRAWTRIPPSWSETEDEYTVWAHHLGEDGDRETDSWEYTFTGADYRRYYGDRNEDPGCIAAVVTVGSLSESENAAIGIGPTYAEHPCDPSRSTPEAVDSFRE